MDTDLRKLINTLSLTPLTEEELAKHGLVVADVNKWVIKEMRAITSDIPFENNKVIMSNQPLPLFGEKYYMDYVRVEEEFFKNIVKELPNHMQSMTI